MRRRTPQPIIITTTASDPYRGPPSPLERNPRSPGWINRDSDGVGLGLVAALERFPSTSPKLVLNLPRVASPPIPIASPSAPRAGFCGLDDDDERKESGLFSASPAGFSGEVAGLFTAGFLSSCYLCKKKLDGRDIYMYGGEKAFCSMECRYRQIVADEYQESCGSVASRPSVEISSSDYSGPRLFYTGIMAA